MRNFFRFPQTKLSITGFAFCALLIFIGLPIDFTFSHHSTAIYDLQQEVSISGEIAEVRWRNPHVYIYVETTSETGQMQQWEIEGWPPNGLRRVGWNRDTLNPGDRVTVIGHPTRIASRSGIYPEFIYKDDSLIFDLQSSNAIVSNAQDIQNDIAESLEGIWATELNPDLLSRLGQGAEFQNLTEAGQRAVSDFDEQTMSPLISCENLVSPLSMFIPDLKKIELGEDSVSIIGDFDGGTRIIHLNMDSQINQETLTHQGRSIGHWDEGSLIVNTTNFNRNRIGNGWGVSSSNQKSTVEKFTLSEDGTFIIYEFTLSDPVYMTAPVEGSAIWRFAPNLEFNAEMSECDTESAERFTTN